MVPHRREKMLARPAPVTSIQSEVLANLRSQAIGGHTVAELGLPEAFLRRVADRITRDSFQDRFRVVRDDLAPPLLRSPAHPIEAPDRPVERRSFRTPAPGEPTGPTDLAGLPPVEHRAAREAMRTLATDGLLITIARTMVALGPSILADGADAALDRLDRLGIPVDLLDWFSIGEARGRVAILRHLASELAGTPLDRIRPRLAKAAFRPTPTVPGFRACADSGQTPLGPARVQIPFARDWLGPGDGGALDLLRSLCEHAPDLRLLVCTPAEQAEALRRVLPEWAPHATVVEVSGEVSQWAQDNARAGHDASGGTALLAPRYPTRGEPAAGFAPGEHAAVAALAGAGVRTARSPLLFQGGNLIVVQEPKQRTLVAGEAEIWRNVSLGLSPAQAREALATEFGCGSVLVLPAASFHIDQEVSIRVTAERTVCFVADAAAGAQAVLAAALDVAERHGIDTAAARATLATGDHRSAADLIGRWLTAHGVAPGVFPVSFAGLFSTGPTDHGPSNLYRVLHASDVLAARDSAGTAAAPDRGARAYLDAFARQFADRRLIRRALSDQGWTVVPIPCMPDPHRGIASINMVHAPDAIYLPAYGGALASADAAAAQAVAAAMPATVRIRPVRSAESQRRSGAVRCAVASLVPSIGF